MAKAMRGIESHLNPQADPGLEFQRPKIPKKRWRFANDPEYFDGENIVKPARERGFWRALRARES